VLLDEIEHDIESKEKFISEQVRTLAEMQANLNTLIEHKSVLAIAADVITGALDAGAQGAINADEEHKGGEQINIPLHEMRAPGEGDMYTPQINEVQQTN
jgi:hypothetical protein